MSLLNELIGGAVDSALREILKKPNSSGKRVRRRKQTTGAARTLREIEKLLKPAKRQTNRKRTTRARSKVRRRSY